MNEKIHYLIDKIQPLLPKSASAGLVEKWEILSYNLKSVNQQQSFPSLIKDRIAQALETLYVNLRGNNYTQNDILNQFSYIEDMMDRTFEDIGFTEKFIGRDLDGVHKEIKSLRRKLQLQQEDLMQAQMKYEQSLAEIDKRVSSADKQFQRKTAELENFLGHSNSLVKEIIENKEQATDLLQRLGTWEQSKGSLYGGEQHKKTADRLRIISCTLMLLAAGFVGFTFFSEGGLDYSTLPYKISISLLFLIPGFYLAKEANKHRDMEFTLFMRGLELETFTPFIAPLEGKIKEQVIEKHTNSFFGQSNIHRNDKGRDNIHVVENIIESVKDIIKKPRTQPQELRISHDVVIDNDDKEINKPSVQHKSLSTKV